LLLRKKRGGGGATNWPIKKGKKEGGTLSIIIDKKGLEKPWGGKRGRRNFFLGEKGGGETIKTKRGEKKRGERGMML